MIRLEAILVPIDFSQQSRRALRYAMDLAAESNAHMIVMHAVNDLRLWELQHDEFGFVGPACQPWPLDRVITEAQLELSRLLEPYGESLERIPR